jgi:SAM-dependent methyltransferase
LSDPEFAVGEFFDDDYLYFYADRLNDRVNEEEAGFIWDFFGLRPGLDVLDVPCGHGRISNRLAARGGTVTGLDSSRGFLAHARRAAAALGVRVDYVEGDMRSLPDHWNGRFDRVLVWFSSLGYFDDAGNRQCLSEIHDALKPGGRVLIDLHNRDWILRNYQADRVLRKNGDLLIDRSTFDLVNSRTLIERTIVRAGSTRTFPYFVRLFTPSEIRDWLRAAGFSSVDVYGDGGGDLTLDSHRLLVCAQK